MVTTKPDIYLGLITLAGLTIADAARLHGVTESAVKHWRTGRLKPTEQRLDELRCLIEEQALLVVHINDGKIDLPTDLRARFPEYPSAADAVLGRLAMLGWSEWP